MKPKQRTYLLVLAFILLFHTACSARPSPSSQPSLNQEILEATLPEASLIPAGPNASPTPVGLVQPTQTPAAAPQTCQPTPPDAEGPFYKAGAPQRDRVGEGYVLRGVVRSAADCAPIPAAQIEFWMAGPDGVYTDDYRATEVVGDDGTYRFESHFPPPYSGRPPHIHLRVSVQGYQTLITQHYPKEGETSASFDLVLVSLP